VALQIAGGIPSAFYSKSLAFRPSDIIPSSGVDSLFEFLDTADKGTALWFAIFDLEGGAINDVPMDATAYVHRDALFYLQTYAVDIGRVSTTTRNFVNGINQVIMKALPNVQFGAYAGYVDPELPNGQQAYWGSNLPRLEQIKRAIDPNDVFHNPQSMHSCIRLFSAFLRYYLMTISIIASFFSSLTVPTACFMASSN
jgi:hypothetical protein